MNTLDIVPSSYYSKPNKKKDPLDELATFKPSTGEGRKLLEQFAEIINGGPQSGPTTKSE